MSHSPPTGRLFTNPDADAAREAFARQPRSLVDKRMSVADAVRQFVRDADYLAIGGFGVNRIPTAVVHEIYELSREVADFRRATRPLTTFNFCAPAT